MTISEFMNRFKIKSKKTVISWIADGLIPGTTKNSQTQNWGIPERAWPPYTKARAKNTNAIYKSIVRACTQRYYPIAKQYMISEKEFDVYIQQLVRANVIYIEEENDVIYYYTTPESEAFLQSNSPIKYIESAIKPLAEAAVTGVTTALINASQ